MKRAVVLTALATLGLLLLASAVAHAANLGSDPFRDLTGGYDQMPKCYLIMLELEDGDGSHKVPLFNHGWATREQAEAQLETCVEEGHFGRLRLSLQAFPIAPASAG